MAKYRISGVWKDSKDVITHYAFHTVDGNTASKAIKKPRSEAVALLETIGNSATTWMWDYKRALWIVGEDVSVVNGHNGKYLRSGPDNTLTNNLEHLIDLDRIFS